jgi:hypothetical protein
MLSIFFKSLENDFRCLFAVDRSHVCECVIFPATAERQVCIPRCEMQDKVSFFFCILVIIVVFNTVL